VDVSGDVEETTQDAVVRTVWRAGMKCPQCGTADVTETVDVWIQCVTHFVEDGEDDSEGHEAHPEDVYGVDYVSICRPCWIAYVKPVWRLLIQVCTKQLQQPESLTPEEVKKLKASMRRKKRKEAK
jgi:hypothetical protein